MEIQLYNIIMRNCLLSFVMFISNSMDSAALPNLEDLDHSELLDWCKSLNTRTYYTTEEEI